MKTDKRVNLNLSASEDNADMVHKGVGRPAAMPDPAFLGRLKEVCEARGITTAAEFADFIGVGRTIGHKWYTGGTASLSGKALFLLADAFEVSPRWLLNGDGPKAAAFRPRSEMELRIINAYRVSNEDERAVVDSWTANQEKIYRDRLQNDVRFTRRGKN